MLDVALMLWLAAGAATMQETPVTITVPVPPASERSRNWTVRLDAITMPANQGAWFRVYAETPGATRATGVEHERYLGEVNILPRSGVSEEVTRGAVLPLPAKFRQWTSGKNALRLTLVPVGKYASPIRVSAVRLAGEDEK